jgi:hypothetical protein
LLDTIEIERSDNSEGLSSLKISNEAGYASALTVKLDDVVVRQSESKVLVSVLKIA